MAFKPTNTISNPLPWCWVGGLNHKEQIKTHYLNAPSEVNGKISLVQGVNWLRSTCHEVGVWCQQRVAVVALLQRGPPQQLVGRLLHPQSLIQHLLHVCIPLQCARSHALDGERQTSSSKSPALHS